MTPTVIGFCAKANSLNAPSVPAAPSAARDLRESRRLKCLVVMGLSGGLEKGLRRKGMRGRWLGTGRGEQADVGRHDAPAFRRAHPGLALAGGRAAGALEFDIGGSEVPAVA